MSSPTMQPATVLPRKGKRTNALAFALADCHTCASLDEPCDRRRPRCSTCLDQGRKCDGFATPLSWNPKRMWSSDPPASIIDHAFNGPGNQGDAAIEVATSRNRAQSFRFVKGPSKPRKRRRMCVSRDHNGADNQPEAQESLPSAVVPTCLPRGESSNNDPSGNSLLGGLGMCIRVFLPQIDRQLLIDTH